MSTFVKVEGHTDFVRDSSSKAIINTNNSEYIAHVNRKKMYELKKNEVQHHQEQIESLKNELLELKSMVTALIKQR